MDRWIESQYKDQSDAIKTRIFSSGRFLIAIFVMRDFVITSLESLNQELFHHFKLVRNFSSLGKDEEEDEYGVVKCSFRYKESDHGVANYPYRWNHIDNITLKIRSSIPNPFEGKIGIKIGGDWTKKNCGKFDTGTHLTVVPVSELKGTPQVCIFRYEIREQYRVLAPYMVIFQDVIHLGEGQKHIEITLTLDDSFIPRLSAENPTGFKPKNGKAALELLSIKIDSEDLQALKAIPEWQEIIRSKIKEVIAEYKQ